MPVPAASVHCVLRALPVAGLQCDAACVPLVHLLQVLVSLYVTCVLRALTQMQVGPLVVSCVVLAVFPTLPMLARASFVTLVAATALF